MKFGFHAPGVGDEEAVVDQPRALHAETEEHVLAGVLVEALLAGDRDDAAGEHREQITGFGQLRVGRPRRSSRSLNRPLAGSAPSIGPKFMVGTYC